MGFFSEFKEFALRGSVVDLAVGLVIGTAFGAIVKSLVDDILMPFLGLFTGKLDFSSQRFVLRGPGPIGNETIAQARQRGDIIISYGQFLNAVITFLIVSLAIFIFVKQINRLRREKKAKPTDPTEKNCPYCFMAIPIRAIRCGHCTSMVTPSAPPPGEPA